MALAGYPLLGTLVAFTPFPSLVASVPVRATVLCFSLYLLVHARVQNWLRPGCLLIMAFWAVYFFRLLWDLWVAHVPVAGEYLFSFIFFCVLPALALLHAPSFDERKLLRWLLAACSVTCVLALIAGYTSLAGARSFTEDNEGRLFLETVNPITFGEIGVTTVLASLCHLRLNTRAADKLLVVTVMVLGLMTIQLAASRGPFVALVACLTALALGSRRFRLMLVPLTGAALLLASGVLDNSNNLLLSRLALSTQTDHSEVRMLMQAAALGQFFESPILGSAIIENYSQDYPHNLFIEAAMATGLLGLVLFIFVFFNALRQIVLRMRAGALLLSLLAIQHLVAGQFSGSIAASAPVWLLLGLLIGAPSDTDADRRILPKGEQ